MSRQYNRFEGSRIDSERIILDPEASLEYISNAKKESLSKILFDFTTKQTPFYRHHWSPKIIAKMNNYHFKLVKFQGDFVWHGHSDTDEVFITLDGDLTIEFRDGKVDFKPGEMFVVPKGIEHKPFAAKECKIMLVEPAGTVNIGDAGSEVTSDENVWI